jgi:hypothetical protein
MINHLSMLLEDFPGPSNQTRCFLHILNIMAKSIIQQFDVPKTKNSAVLDKAAQALANLAEGLETEEEEAYEAQEYTDDKGDDPPLDRWIDFGSGLTDKQREEIELGI